MIHDIGTACDIHICVLIALGLIVQSRRDPIVNRHRLAFRVSILIATLKGSSQYIKSTNCTYQST
jgi:hypothetical protein